MKGSQPPRCRLHLGTSPEIHRLRQYLESQARVLAKLDDAVPLDVDQVLDAHLKLAGEASAWLDALRQLVRDLPTIVYRTGAGETAVRTEVTVYTAAMDRLNRILTDVGRLNVADRLVALREGQSRALLAIITAAIAGELADEDARRRILTAVAAGLRDQGLAAIEAAP